MSEVLNAVAGLKVVYKVDNVPFYKHTEEFKLGQSVSMSRRDKKPGQQHAAMRALPKGVEVDIQLDPPYSGNIFSLDLINTSPCPDRHFYDRRSACMLVHLRCLQLHSYADARFQVSQCSSRG